MVKVATKNLLNSSEYSNKTSKKKLIEKEAFHEFCKYQKEKLILKINGFVYFIDQCDIIFIEKKDRKSIIHTQKKNYELYSTLESFKGKLCNNFFQSHQSFIVNIKYIETISPTGATYHIQFKDYKEQAFITRQKLNALYKIFDT
ncbi:MAG TPA: LytTR family transcriptional regulator [Bacillales bacterium]|nr:LytTR family transcriptional regulator [Bacillales bacterium]